MTDTHLHMAAAPACSEGCHTVYAKLGDKEIHRDEVLLDRADDRRRFIEAFVTKLPAIRPNAEVSPDDLEAKLIALASEAPPAIAWQEPDPIDQPDLPEFPVDALPPVLADWVSEESEATQTPPAMAALLSLAVCGATIAKRVSVQAWAGWCEPCNLYVAAILDPANRKSAVFADATGPLREVETEWREESEEIVAEELSRHRQAEKRLAKLERTAAEDQDSIKRDQARGEALELAKQLANWKIPEVPTLIVDDATSEKLAILLQSNQERIASMSAEGGVFDLMAGKYAKNGAADINVYLMGHSGDSVSVHRVGRPDVYLDSPALTMALAIQPEVIRGIADNSAFRGRGLLGRFLYAVPKSWIGRRKIATPPVSEVTRLAYAHAIKSLSLVEPAEDGRPHEIRLSSEAVVSFKAFCESLEAELGSGSLESMQDWGGKLAGATLRIAAVIHVAYHIDEGGLDQDIDLNTIERAQRIASWAIPHAAAALELLNATHNETREDAAYILRWLRNSRLNEPTFDRRDVQRHGQRRFNGQPARLDAVLAFLESTGHVAKIDGLKSSRRVTYAVSPYVQRRGEDSSGVVDDVDKQSASPSSFRALAPLSTESETSRSKRTRMSI